MGTFCRQTLSAVGNGANDSEIDAKTLWPWASIRWWHLACEKIIWLMETDVATFTVQYRTSPILLTSNILTFLYENFVFRKMV
jgi:hypothetical protein